MSAPNTQLSTAYQTLVTGGASGSAVVMLSFCNNSGGAIEIDVNVVPNAGSDNDDNQIIDNLTVNAGDTYVFNEKLLLAVGETVQAKASANTSVTNIASFLDL